MNTVFSVYARFEKILQAVSPAVDLAIRLYIAWVFFKSGLLKIQSWESTLALFEYEYAVPLLSTEMAAYLGTAAELVLPVLLALGLAGRFAALALFLFNIVAVISYPDLSDVGRQHHLYWGMLLAMLAVHGSGLLSADGWLARRCKACPS
jgi:putative oxidoreductase